jgi:triosephosphate isomerase
MPRNIIAGNWKMNTTFPESIALAIEIREQPKPASGCEVVIFPPFTSLLSVRDALRGTYIQTGAQNVYPEESGAFTGEIAPNMLQDLCQYVLVGHSERRTLFNESNELIRKKIEACVNSDLKPFLCIGENSEQKINGDTSTVLKTQLESALSGLNDISNLVIAYEPVWAIGTGETAIPEEVDDIMGNDIKTVLRSLFGNGSNDTPLLYGGSINPGNISNFVGLDNVNGALVGGASLNANQFCELVRQFSKST